MYKSFKDMPIWQKSLDVAELIFAMTEKLPRKEDFGFTSQIRRSALSISANIAEAYGRFHQKDKVNFYNISRGSITETQSHFEYGVRVGYIEQCKKSEINEILDNLYNDINKVILTLKKQGRC